MTKSLNYLIVGPAWVGDCVMAQTLFKVLKQKDPNCNIDVLAPDWTRSLLSRMLEVRQAISLPIAHKEVKLLQRWQLGRRLRNHHYDQAIVLPNSFKSALIPYFAGIAKRTGWLGEFRFGLLNDIYFLNEVKLPLMIQRFAALGLAKNFVLPEVLPVPSLSVNKDNLPPLIAKFRLDLQKPILALCPGAEYGPAKRWPEEYFAEIAMNKLSEGWQVWLFGSGKDQQQVHQIQQATQAQCINLIGQTNLAEAIDLLSLVDMVVSNDSGLMHIACALAKPVIVIYGSSSARFTPPLSETAKTLSLNLACSPCFKRTCPLDHLNCLRQLTPADVLLAIESFSKSDAINS